MRINIKYGYYYSNGLIYKGEKLCKLGESKGYPTIYITEDKKSISVHRFLAINLIPNPENKLHVNHKNGIKHDNRLRNLEWTTPHENMIHAHKMGLNKLPDRLPYLLKKKNER